MTDAAVQDTRVVPYNVVPELDERTACVIIEPIAANMGLVPPDPGFLTGLRAECDRVGALLVFDEVITGFRVARGGAQELFGLAPDLTTMGKVIGGGLNIGAYGGRADVMEVVAPLGPVYQAGTLSGNPLATAAGLAVLDLLDDAAYATLRGRAEGLAAVLRRALDAAGIVAHVPVASTLVGLYLGDPLPSDYDGARATDEARVRQAVPRLARPGRGHGPGGLRGDVPRPRPHRRRAGRGRGRGHRGRRGRRVEAVTRARRWRRGPARAWARGCRPTRPSRSGAGRACTGPGSGCRSAASPR